MLNADKITTAFSRFLPTESNQTEVVASSNHTINAKWEIISADVCPDCKQIMQATLCMNTKALVCMPCRIMLPMPNGYVPNPNAKVPSMPSEDRAQHSGNLRINPMDQVAEGRSTPPPIFFDTYR
jgi:hypothetical protein